MKQSLNLELEDIQELSQIWYECQVLDKEPSLVQKKFYSLIERIFEEAKTEATQKTDREIACNIARMANRLLLLERLMQALQYNQDLAALFEKQCLDLVRTNS